MSLKSKEKSVADTGAYEHLVALPNRSARRLPPSIPTRTGGAIGSVFLTYVWARLIHDQHDRVARVWEEGAVETAVRVLSECCSFDRQKHFAAN